MREVLLPTQEMGEVRLVLLRGWEAPWDAVRGTVFGDQFSRVSREAVDHALHRWSRPLVYSLGIPPEGALLKIPESSRWCWLRKSRSDVRACPLQGPECRTTAENMPWCFEPDDVPEQQVRRVAAQAIEYWRKGTYIVVVEEDEND